MLSPCTAEFNSGISLINHVKESCFNQSCLTEFDWTSYPISFLFVEKKPGSRCCKLSSKTPEKDEDKQEAIASLAAAKEISLVAAVAEVLSELDFDIQGRTKHGTEGFSQWTTLFRLSPTGFCKR